MTASGTAQVGHPAGEAAQPAARVLSLLDGAIPSADDLAQCVHCGLCLPSCPTYLATGSEAESPRGRVHLIQAFNAGRIEANGAYRQHLELCLVCRNCEAVCPSGVHFGRIMEAGRAQLQAVAEPSLPRKLYWRIVFRELLPHQARLRAVASGLRLYQRSGLQAVVRRLGLLPEPLRSAERLLPPLPRPFVPRFEVYRAVGPAKYRVGLFTGCIMPLAYGPVHEATIRVLTWNGCEVHVPREQTCCGALNVHAGERAVARDLARANVRAFLGRGLDAIVVNSAGCGSTMKEYGDLLATADAAEFARLAKDVNEFLAAIELKVPTHTVNRVATFQESCHLVHAQRIKDAPRTLLAMVPGLELRDMEHPDRCCGSAGLYMLTQREMSQRLLDERMGEVQATGATTLVTANPGCLMQLQAGVAKTRLRADVKHVVELLDEAYGGPRR